MRLCKRDIGWCKRVAKETGLSATEVRKAILSYFDDIVSTVNKLPFDTPKRIYSIGAFAQHSVHINIPHLGRLGTMYSQYLRWRSQESKETDRVLRKDARQEHRKPLIEKAARQAMAGSKVDTQMLRGRIPAGKYSTVWLIDGDNRKKAAKQMIVNNN